MTTICLDENEKEKKNSTELTERECVDGDTNVRIRELFGQLADETTWHGIKQLHEAKGARKATWTVALLLAIALTVMLFSTTISHYFAYRTYIETQLREDITSLAFPTITLCLSDNYNDLKFKSFPGNVTFEEYKTIFAVLHRDLNIDEDVIALFERLNISSYEKLITSVHLTLDDTVLNDISLILNHNKPCSFSKEKCTMDDLKLVWMMDGLHSCVQFNSYKPYMKGRSQAVIFSPFRMYLDLGSRRNKLLFRKGLRRYHGFHVLIHDYGIPHHLYRGKNNNTVLLEKFYISPGTRYRFHLDRHELTLLPPPHGTCGKKDLSVVRYYPYSVSTCIMDCQLQYVVNKCKCIRFDLKYLVDAHIPICDVSQMIRCYINANRNARRIMKLCIDNCPLHCLRHEYNIHREEGNLPSHHYGKMEQTLGWSKTNRSKTINYLKTQVIGVEVMYRKMREVSQKYTPLVSLSTLLATIGGSIGLGMGISLLTIVEWTMFVIDSVKMILCRKKMAEDNVLLSTPRISTTAP